MLWPTCIAAFVAALILIFGNINYDKEGTSYMILIWIAVISSIYAIVANVSYIWIGLKGKLKLSGGSVAHAGFGLMLLGILISSSKKEILSFNTSGIVVSLGEGSEEKPGENLTLIKDVKTSMGKYWVTYKSDSANPNKPLWYFNIKFERKDGKEGFILTPNAFVNYKGNEGLMANPDAKHYWDRDVFTYVTSLPDPTKRQDTAQFKIMTINQGDSISYSNGSFVLEKLVSQSNIPASGLEPGDVASMATIRVFSRSGTIYIAEPILISSKGQTLSLPDSLTTENLIFQLNKVESENIEIGVKETDPVIEYVTLKAYKFPFINLLWMGTVIMVAGLIISTINRIAIYKSVKVHKKANENVPGKY
jgi:cytochrome c-type biogenesis protein CcmF